MNRTIMFKVALAIGSTAGLLGCAFEPPKAPPTAFQAATSDLEDVAAEALKTCGKGQVLEVQRTFFRCK